MCMFPFPNNAVNGIAFKKGVKEFNCGGCPECLNARARQWALRCSMQAKNDIGMMLTLTYDSYIRDEKGNIIGENVADRNVDKKDCQDFIKRLRWHYPNNDIKYLITAEYGKRTGRPHYHALIFGLVFDDLIPNKKSKRGNLIYRSFTLEKIWKNGICSVDCTNLNAKTARYCTKYCSKDYGVDDTFMLFSRGIGEEQLLKEFNGLNYIIEGREYAIPRKIWQRVIEDKFAIEYKYLNPKRFIKNEPKYLVVKDKSNVEYKYVSYQYLNKYFEKNRFNYVKAENVPVAAYIAYSRNARHRERFRIYRDSYTPYKRYLEYWKTKAEFTKRIQAPVPQRILALPNDKYFFYKQKALKTYQSRLSNKLNVDLAISPPRSNCVKRLGRAKENWLRSLGICPTPSRHLRANDRKYRYFQFRNDFSKLLELCKLD